MTKGRHHRKKRRAVSAAGITRPIVGDSSQPIAEQLNRVQSQIKRAFPKKTQIDIALNLGLTLKTVSRLMRKRRPGIQTEGERKEQDACDSILIGQYLGLRPEYVAVGVARDTITAKLQSLRRPNSSLNTARESLERAIEFMQPFASQEMDAPGKHLGLAFRLFRISVEASNGRGGGVAERRRLLEWKMFERGKTSVPASVVYDWADSIQTDGRKRVQAILRELRGAQRVSSDSFERVAEFPPRRGDTRGVWQGGDSQPTLRWYCPHLEGRVEVSRVPTVLGAIEVEEIVAHVKRAPPVPSVTDRSVVRCAGASHRGYEVSVVTHGAVLLTISTKEFAKEDPGECPNFEEGVLHHGLYGPGEVAIFDSGQFHRCEFLAPYNRVISFNLRRSVMLHDKCL